VEVEAGDDVPGAVLDPDPEPVDAVAELVRRSYGAPINLT
jgi:hypothetical protein